jgi:hypothetical protein
MKTLSFSTLFLPEWALPWVLVFAIAAWILGARPLAMVAAFIFLFEVIVSPLLAPWLATLPTPALLLIGVVMALMLFHGAIELLFGKKTAGHVTGVYLVRLLDAFTLGPFRLLGRLLRGHGGR